MSEEAILRSNLDSLSLRKSDVLISAASEMVIQERVDSSCSASIYLMFKCVGRSNKM